MNRQMDIMDMLSILTVIMQLLNYESEKVEASNNDIMLELQKQNEKYFEEILRNQKLIIDNFAELNS